MNKKTGNFLNQVRASNLIYANKPTTLTLVVPLVTAFTKQAQLYGEARVLARQTKASDGSMAEDKEAKLLAASVAVALGFKALLPHAVLTGDTVLQAFADRSASDLVRVKDPLIIGELEEGVAKLREYLPALAEYGVTSAELDAADDLIDSAGDALGNPRNLVIDRGTAVEKLETKVSEIRTLQTKVVDPLVDRMKMPGASEEAVTFAMNYERARVIINLGENVNGDEEETTPPRPVV